MIAHSQNLYMILVKMCRNLVSTALENSAELTWRLRLIGQNVFGVIRTILNCYAVLMNYFCDDRIVGESNYGWFFLWETDFYSHLSFAQLWFWRLSTGWTMLIVLRPFCAYHRLKRYQVFLKERQICSDFMLFINHVVGNFVGYLVACYPALLDLIIFYTRLRNF